MKNILILIFVVAAIGCNTDKSEATIDCNCNEVMDKKLVVHEYPHLHFEYNIYVRYCDGTLKWIDLKNQNKYEAINRGDCY